MKDASRMATGRFRPDSASFGRRVIWLLPGLALTLLITILPFVPALPAHAATLAATRPQQVSTAQTPDSNTIDPASKVIWQLGKNDNAASEFSDYTKANPEKVTVPGDWATRSDWSFMSKGLKGDTNPAMEIHYQLNDIHTIPKYGVMFTVHILDAYEAEPQMAVFSNGFMAGMIQIAGMNGTGSAYPYEKVYRLYIPIQFLRPGANTLRLETVGCMWCSSQESQYLWWQWDYLQLAALDAPATEPLHGRYTNLGTTIVKDSFAYDQDTIRMAPYALKWLGIAYSGNVVRSAFWTDTTGAWQPNAKAWLQMLRDYNTATVADHINGQLLGNKLNADGTLPQAVQDEYTNFFKTYGSLMQYYEIDNEPGLFNMPLANEIAMAKYLHDNLPTLAPNVQLVAPGWAYWPNNGTPSGWERDPASRYQVEQYTALTNGHAYNSLEGGRGISFLENLLTYGQQGLLTGDGLPKPMLTTEVGAYDGANDDARYGAAQTHAAAFDRIMRGHVGYADIIGQFATFSFNDLNLLQDNWTGDPAATGLWPGTDNNDPRLETYRRLALAYATHGKPLLYAYLNPQDVTNKHVYFRGVDTSTLAPLPGSGGKSSKVLLNFVNFDPAGSTPVKMHVAVNLPQNATYSGERFGSGNTYAQAHSYVRDLKGPIADLTVTLKPGESVQYILDKQTPLATASAPTHVTANAGNTEAQLNWWDASTTTSGDVTYNVKRATTAGGPYTTVASNLTTTSYIDTGLTNGTTYYYVVTAVNTAGESPGSMEVSAKPSDHLRYEAEQGVLSGGASVQNDSAASGGAAVGNLHLSGATVTFNNVDGGPTGGDRTLVLRFATAISSATKGLIVNGTRVKQLTFPDTGAWSGANAYSQIGTTVTLKPGFTNTIAITNDFSAGDQGGIALDYIELSNDQIDTTPPTAPGNLTVTASTNTSVTLSWSPASDNVGVTQYLVYNSGGVVATTDGQTTTATVSNLTPGTDYSFTVKARDAFSNLSPDSNTATVTTDATPIGLQAFPGITRIKLSWTGNTGTGITYNVKRATTQGGPYTTVATGVTTTTYVDNGLTNGTAYYYVVSATTARGESANSNEASATPADTIVYAAKNAEIGGGANRQGDGSVGGMDSCGAFVIFHNVDGDTDGGGRVIRISYSTALSNVSKSIYVNGGLSQAVTFQGTGGWGTFATMDVTIGLRAGMDNTVTIKNDGCGNGLNIMSITLLPGKVAPPPPPQLPDLIVTGVGGFTSTQKVGQAITFTMTVKNIGTAGTPDGIPVSGSMLDSQLGQIAYTDTDSKSLAPGASITLTCNWPVGGWVPSSARTYTITAFINDINRFPELDMSNNKLTFTLTVS